MTEMVVKTLGSIKNAGELADSPLLIEQLINNEMNALWKADPAFLAIKARENSNIPAVYFVDFIKKAQLTGADPRLNQVYLIPCYKNGKQSANVVFAYQFFMSRASKSGLLEWFKVETEIEKYFSPVNGNVIETLVSTCWVKRKDHDYPIYYKARFPEFAPKKLTYTWQSKPYLMLEKCSIANAFRWAFPEALSGMYISEEITGDELEERKQKPVQDQNEQPPMVTAEIVDPPQYVSKLDRQVKKAFSVMTDAGSNKELESALLSECGSNSIDELLNKPDEDKESALDWLRNKYKEMRDKAS